MRRSGKKRCMLPTLENPALNGILFGLDIKEGELCFQPDAFPCCHATGTIDDPTANSVRSCSLLPRRADVHELLVQFYTTWGELNPRHPHLISAGRSATILREVADVLKGNRAQATLTTSDSRGQPSELWAVALTAAWRFGVPVYVRTLGRFTGHPFIDLKKSLQGTNGPSVIILEQVDKLWDSAVVTEFEALVSQAYQINACLWVEFLKNDEPTSKSKTPFGNSASEIISRRVSHLKQRSPFDFLDASVASRLKRLSTVPRPPIFTN
jgi:hypothetical protein